MSLNKDERLSSLKDIRSIVCGIRIFNKDVGHSSEGIIDCKQEKTEVTNEQKIILTKTIINYSTTDFGAVMRFNKINFRYNTVWCIGPYKFIDKLSI